MGTPTDVCRVGARALSRFVPHAPGTLPAAITSVLPATACLFFFIFYFFFFLLLFFVRVLVLVFFFFFLFLLPLGSSSSLGAPAGANPVWRSRLGGVE